MELLNDRLRCAGSPNPPQAARHLHDSELVPGLSTRRPAGALARDPSVDELAFPGLQESDEKVDELLVGLYVSGRASLSLA